MTHGTTMYAYFLHIQSEVICKNIQHLENGTKEVVREHNVNSPTKRHSLKVRLF